MEQEKVLKKKQKFLLRRYLHRFRRAAFWQ